MRTAERGRRRKRIPYWLSFATVTAVLLAVTAVLVLVVLPERFVLQAGLRESGITFPSAAPRFEPPARTPVVEPRRPPRATPPAPGPAESLWSQLAPLLAAGRNDEAAALMNEYLRANPRDVGVRRERARALLAAGRPALARAELERLAADPGARVDRLALARFLRDAGEVDRAVAMYRDLIGERPADLESRRELASTLLWAERYKDAEEVLRDLLARSARPAYRLDLARALYWSGRLEEARAELALIPADGDAGAEARALDREIAALLAPPEAPPESPDESPLARARRAAAEGDLQAAAALYRQAVEGDPENAEIWREWIDLQQLRLENLEGARDGFRAYEERFGLTPGERYRLAELLVWTGRPDEAELELERLLREDPGHSAAWSLLGDLHRWRGDRVAAASTYRQALELNASDARALAGREELRRQRESVFLARDGGRLGPAFGYRGDSDDYRRYDVAAEGRLALRPSLTALSASAGYEWLEGFDLSGLPSADEGPFAEVELARWWREATVRTALRGRVQHLDAAGLEPTVGLDVEVPNAGGVALAATVEHGPAYPLTSTLESVLDDVRAERLTASAYRALGERWAAGLGLDLALLTHTESDALRWGAGVTVVRELSDLVVARASTSFLSVADAAPRSALRALYWDPLAFWSNTLSVGLEARPVRGWGYVGQLTGGAAFMDERGVPGTEWVPQIGIEGGVLHRGERDDLEVRAFYRRGRERDYSSWGIDFRLGVRP